MQKGQAALIIVAVILALSLAGLVLWKAKPTQNLAVNTTLNKTASTSGEAVDTLSKGMRKLWEDHIVWTRMYLISAANNLKDLDSVTQRLLANQEDLGNAIKPYYGEEAGSTLTRLLKTHITTAADLVTAAKKNDQTAQKTANDKWYANAQEIADFLAAANPGWTKEETRVMMNEHLDLTKQEAVDIVSGKDGDGIADYDKVHDQILKMADLLTDGIVRQFPDKFE